MKEPAWLTIEAVVAFHEQVVAEHGGAGQLRDRGLLESALASPKNHFAYGERDLFVLAAAYARAIARNHPFIDGNKRAAFLAAYTVLGINGFSLIAPESEAVAYVEGLAARRVSEGDFSAWLRRSCVRRGPEGKPRRGKPRRSAKGRKRQGRNRP